jgi:hypothetical protein
MSCLDRSITCDRLLLPRHPRMHLCKLVDWKMLGGLAVTIYDTVDQGHAPSHCTSGKERTIDVCSLS